MITPREKKSLKANENNFGIFIAEELKKVGVTEAMSGKQLTASSVVLTGTVRGREVGSSGKCRRSACPLAEKFANS